jgi:hypothetical protein
MPICWPDGQASTIDKDQKDFERRSFMAVRMVSLALERIAGEFLPKISPF